MKEGLTSQEVKNLVASGAMSFSTRAEGEFVADCRRYQEYESAGTPSIPSGKSADGEWIELEPSGRRRVNHFLE